MEALSLAAGIILMIVAAIGILFYVALVIAIPVCRMLDWFFDREADTKGVSPAGQPKSAAVSARGWLQAFAQHLRGLPHHNGEHGSRSGPTSGCE